MNPIEVMPGRSEDDEAFRPHNWEIEVEKDWRAQVISPEPEE